MIRGSKIENVIKVGGVPCHHVRTLKADSVATTCLYKGAGSSFIVKTGQPHPAFLFLARSAARYLVNREVAMYKRLGDLEGVPRLIEKKGSLSFVREYIPGRVLDKKKPVPDDFFDRLHTIVRGMHHRGVAHVDIEKPQNILVGDDGKPYLIDFQISFCTHHVPSWLRPLAGPVFRRLKEADWYHFYKHKRRTRPDLTTLGEERIGRRRSLLLAIHRVLIKPYFRIRRTLLHIHGESPPLSGNSHKRR